MTLWMTLRIGQAGLGLAGDNPVGLLPARRHDAQPTSHRARLSTRAVHERAALTCRDAAVNRIHRAYYDYHSSL